MPCAAHAPADEVRMRPIRGNEAKIVIARLGRWPDGLSLTNFQDPATSCLQAAWLTNCGAMPRPCRSRHSAGWNGHQAATIGLSVDHHSTYRMTSTVRSWPVAGGFSSIAMSAGSRGRTARICWPSQSALRFGRSWLRTWAGWGRRRGTAP